MAKTLQHYENQNKIIRKREDTKGREYWQEDEKDGSGYSRIDTSKKNVGKAIGGMGGAKDTRRTDLEDDQKGGKIGVGDYEPSDWWQEHNYKHSMPRCGINIPSRGCETVSVTSDSASKIGTAMQIEKDDNKEHTTTTFYFTVKAKNGDTKTVVNNLEDLLKCQAGGSGGVVIQSG